MKKIRPYLRQVHLDFHTSEHIPDIGIKFSEAQFIETLQVARGHHGWCYYPTDTARVTLSTFPNRSSGSTTSRICSSIVICSLTA